MEQGLSTLVSVWQGLNEAGQQSEASSAPICFIVASQWLLQSVMQAIKCSQLFRACGIMVVGVILQ